MAKTTYYLFGFIKLWTVTRDIKEDEMFEAMSVRFKEELDRAILRRG